MKRTIILGLTFFFALAFYQKAIAAGQAMVDVKVVKAEFSAIPVSFTTFGQVVSPKSVVIHPLISGIIKRLEVKTGAYVRINQVIAQLDDTLLRSKLRQLEAQIRALQTLLNQTKAQWEINKKLYRLGIISRLERLKAQAAYQRLKADIAVLKVKRQGMIQRLAYMKIKSPVAGYVDKLVSIGTYVDASKAVCEVVSPQNGYVEAFIPLSVKLKKGDKAKIWAQEGLILGEVKTVIYQSNQSGFKKAIVVPKSQLAPGERVRVEIIKGIVKGIKLPKQALIMTRGAPTVFIVKRHQAEARHVSILYDNGQDIIISSGIKGGEWVVTEGAYLLTDKTRVNILK